MQCPACGTELTQVSAGPVSVDACQGGCGGLWFDAFELRKVDEPSEAVGGPLLELERNPNVAVNLEERRHCPKCPGVVMMRHFSSIQHQIQVDECPACGGIWLDVGELSGIRGEFSSEAERHEAADKYCSDVFGPQLAELHAKSAADAQRARKIASAFRLLCPSAYLPGKQSWGAF
jgi:uncharacterized protein